MGAITSAYRVVDSDLVAALGLAARRQTGDRVRASSLREGNGRPATAHLTPSPGVWTVISTPIVCDLIRLLYERRSEVRGDLTRGDVWRTYEGTVRERSQKKEGADAGAAQEEAEAPWIRRVSPMGER